MRLVDISPFFPVDINYEIEVISFAIEIIEYYKLKKYNKIAIDIKNERLQYIVILIRLLNIGKFLEFK